MPNTTLPKIGNQLQIKNHVAFIDTNYFKLKTGYIIFFGLIGDMDMLGKAACAAMPNLRFNFVCNF